MVEKSMMECDEIAGTYDAFSVHPGEQHRGPMQVEDADRGDMPGLADGAGTTKRPRDSQVDDSAIEYTPAGPYMGPRTLAQEAQHGGFAQPGDQSYPEEPHRTVAGTRGAHDIGQIAGYGAEGQDTELDVV